MSDQTLIAPPPPDADKLARWPDPYEMAVALEEGRYRRAKHLEHIAKHLRDAVTKGDLRLIVQVPVRHGKSMLISQWLPIWFLTHKPTAQVMLASYDGAFANTWGRRVRDKLNEHGEVLGIAPERPGVAAHDFALKQGGGMLCAGVGGPLTGRGADLLIIDDPVKNAEEANSEVMREKMWEWFRSVALTRLEPGASVVVVMSRWHEDDLSGRIQADMALPDGEKWQVIDLPALAEEDDPLGRAPGAALWPDRYARERLLRMKRQVGSYTWNATYQQHPAPPEGALFKREWLAHLYRPVGGGWYLCPPALRVRDKQLRRFATFDGALSTATSADYSVIACWASWTTREGATHLLLLDLWRERQEAPDVERKLRAVHDTFDPMFIGVEAAFYGLALIQRYRRTGLRLKPLKPDQDKITRAQMAVTMLESGWLWLPEHAPWRDVLERELLSFPHGKHDDIVDCVSYAALVAQALHPVRASAHSAGDPTMAEFGAEMPGFGVVHRPDDL